MSTPLVSSTVSPFNTRATPPALIWGGIGLWVLKRLKKSSSDTSVDIFNSSEQAAYGQDGKTKAQVLEEQRVVDALQSRDREVRQHERAHQAAGAGHTGPVSYTFQKGPDGRLYAIGGEVGIDTSAVSGDQGLH